MFNYEKFVNSRFSVISDWIIKLVIVNVLIIVMSLPVLTILPATVAGLGLLKRYRDGKSDSIFKGYFIQFTKNLKKTLILNVLFLLTLGMIVYNITTYYVSNQVDASTINSIGLYVMIIFALFYILTLVHVGHVIIYYPHLNVLMTIKLSFVIAFKYILSTLMMLGAWIPTILIIIFLPPLVSFIAFSLPLFISLIVSKPIYTYLKTLNTEGDSNES
ncbi:DUF624 domain-containing protein [Haloplasma contractile]|uniref:Integral membrane protein n=1 Tax=Haloplasma contractile SSD-17B TaxID=1033810 RepID=U2DTD0_9MOLU|nr:DUF624 domain-containing protein [Haloplasma contractile]ERJ11742.1 integral membrane protein [Haloplasma contractile SSD-17B]